MNEIAGGKVLVRTRGAAKRVVLVKGEKGGVYELEDVISLEEEVRMEWKEEGE